MLLIAISETSTNRHTQTENHFNARILFNKLFPIFPYATHTAKRIVCYFNHLEALRRNSNMEKV